MPVGVGRVNLTNNAPHFHARAGNGPAGPSSRCPVVPVRRRLRGAKTQAWKELKYDGEYDFNLAEYMVELDQPLGLTLAPDLDGKIFVVKIHEGLPAAKNGVIVEGDVLKKCSNAWGEFLCNCTDLRQVQWAIKSRRGKVRLLLERRKEAGSSKANWHRAGKLGLATSVSRGYQLPLHFVNGRQREWTGSGQGRPARVTFHRLVKNNDNRPPRSVRDAMRAARLREGLVSGLTLPYIILPVQSFHESTNGHLTNGKPQKGKPPSSYAGGNSWPANAAVPTGRLRRNGQQPELHTKNECVMKVIPVMSWLLVSNTRLTHPDVIEVASQCGLQCLLELRLQPCHGGVAVVGSCTPCTKIQAFVAAVAALHRLIKRREVILEDKSNGCSTLSVLVHCDNDMGHPVAALIAAYCHWYGFMALSEAIELAEIAMSARVPKGLVEEATESLYKAALDRQCAVSIVWRYGGQRVEVVGDVVGGWENSAPLKPCPANPSPCQFVPHGSHYLCLKGLMPGVYNYKFIVDGSWEVDFLGPKVMDVNGNWNNVLYVKPDAYKRKGMNVLEMVRLEAALVALRTKGGKT